MKSINKFPMLYAIVIIATASLFVMVLPVAEDNAKKVTQGSKKVVE